MKHSQEIFRIALQSFGMDTSDGPDDGKLAGPWAVFRILQKAGICEGEDIQYSIVGIEAAMKDRWQQAALSEAIPGDICVLPEKAIAIYVGNNEILANSSSQASFSWRTKLKDWLSCYQQDSVNIYRVIRR